MYFESLLIFLKSSFKIDHKLKQIIMTLINGGPIQKASILTFFFLGTPSHSLFEGTPSHSHRLTHTTLSPLPHNFPLLPEEKKKEISSRNETNLKLACLSCAGSPPSQRQE